MDSTLVEAVVTISKEIHHIKTICMIVAIVLGCLLGGSMMSGK